MKRNTPGDTPKGAAPGGALTAFLCDLCATGTNPPPTPSEAAQARLAKGQLIVFDGDSTTNRRSEKRADTWPYLRLMNCDKIWPDIMSELLYRWLPDQALAFFHAGSSARPAGACQAARIQRMGSKPTTVTMAHFAEH